MKKGMTFSTGGTVKGIPTEDALLKVLGIERQELPKEQALAELNRLYQDEFAPAFKIVLETMDAARKSPDPMAYVTERVGDHNAGPAGQATLDAQRALKKIVGIVGLGWINDMVRELGPEPATMLMQLLCLGVGDVVMLPKEVAQQMANPKGCRIDD